MRKLLLLSFATFLLSSANLLSAQEQQVPISILKSSKLTVSADGKLSTLEGNVAFACDKLDVTKAEKVIIDRTSNKITVAGYSEFSFHGRIVVVPTPGGKHTRLEYTPGEDVAYIK